MFECFWCKPTFKWLCSLFQGGAHFRHSPAYLMNSGAPCTPSGIWPSGSKRSEKCHVPSFLLSLSSLSLIFQTLCTCSRGDQRSWHNAQLVAPSKIWYTTLSQWGQSQGMPLVCLWNNKHVFVVSLENFKSGHGFSSLLWDQQEVLFLSLLVKMEFLFFRGNAHCTDRSRASTCLLSCGTELSVSEGAVPHFEVPIGSQWWIWNPRPLSPVGCAD